ncbi:hypothetical protein B0H21DRAFT_701913 [Amylocystis lapponica]|nr:hypothetical protein B0H21DRAFT_701913 [Amylocystis lapponica]
MRQTGMTDDDIRFRTALANMRYKSCTPEDLQLLRSRIIRPHLQNGVLDSDNFRYVSIITGRNAHRDAINHFMVERFAKETGQDVHNFHSVDRWSSTGRGKSNSLRQDLRDDVASIEPVQTSNILHPELQNVVWKIPPALTDHHVGVLALCRDMPVLLKHNEATELCATNGAEAVVVDWDAHSLPGGEEVLDTLFVRLVNPPRTIHIPGLTINVVPLTPVKKRVSCLLPNDHIISLERFQVMVLQNFAMTDYASQGRTRPYNPCHLRHCRGHQSIYTALSRSSSLAGTAILDSFGDSSLTGGAAGSLRREFRELEILDEITRLHFESLGVVPFSLASPTRASIISAYQTWRGARHVPHRVDAALRWERDPFKPPSEPNKWMLVSAPPPPQKRSRMEASANDVPRKRVKLAKWAVVVTPPSPPVLHGFIWDSDNWSCAYDSLLTIMWNMYLVAGDQWLNTVTSQNALTASLLNGFALARNDLRLLEMIRNRLRDLLFSIDGTRFARRGPVTASVVDVAEQLLTSVVPYGTTRNTCSRCGLVASDVSMTSFVWTMYPSLWASPNIGHTTVSTATCMTSIAQHTLQSRCRTCTSGMVQTLNVTHEPPVIALEIFPPSAIYPTIDLSLTVQIQCNGTPHAMHLAGVVYAGFNHFTSRFIDRTDAVWFYDGASTARDCRLESTGVAPPSLDSAGRTPCLVVYETH